MQKLMINLKERGYPIYIGSGFLSELGEYIETQIPTAHRSFVITDSVVDKLYGDVVMESLHAAGLNPEKGVILNGEESKSLETATGLYDQLVAHGMERTSVIISLGGGVVGDLAGFVAATYMRGVPFVQVPTTLLAQVDSSIGGKVAVNHPAGKNLIGAFHQPQLVLIDTNTLATLPKEELIAGMGEVIKHGMILNADYFDWIEANIPRILNLESATLNQLVFGSCTIKGKIVEMDEYERNIRAILNFGHTIGHALETLTHYRRYRHGEAIAIGMAQVSKLAQFKGMVKTEAVDRLIKLLTDTGLPTELPTGINPEDLLQTIKQDKKSHQGKIKIILPTTIGNVQITDQWDEQDLLKMLTTSI